ncbi:MAG TPA: hypothetical protein VJ722_06085 [Rhodanobacteraceae bacterium]|nr:hypothetical protein [Rhodanobacteraceae bacterium]
MRRHLPTIALAALSCAFGAQAATKHKPEAGPAKASSAAQPDEASPAEKARIEALVQYQRDLVTVNALRSDAVHLLGAALLARPLPDQKPELSFHRLAERAAAASDAGPGITWVRLADCDGQAGTCPNPDMLKKLQEQAADNAAVWMLAMDAAAQKNDEEAERAALAKAAAARNYDDYFGIALQGIASVVGTLPPLPASMQGGKPGDPKSALGVGLLIAFGVANQHPRPSLDPLLDLCAAEHAGKDDALKSDCLKVAHALEWGSSPVGRAVGLHIHGELDPSAKASTDKDARDLAWQMQSYGALGIKSFDDDAIAGPLLQAARSGGTELSLVLSTLRANGISTDAPADWQPGPVRPAPTASSGG